MSDSTAPDPQQLSSTNSDDDNFPLIPSKPEGDNEHEAFGMAPPMDMLTPLAGGKKVDPRTLPGAFFFLDVFPSKRSDAVGQPSTGGSFNALAYDPGFTGKETPDQVSQRYLHSPPYIETLTDPNQDGGNMADIKGSRDSITGLFGSNQTTWSATKWYYKEPILLTLSFRYPADGWGWNRSVGRASTCSGTDSIYIRSPVKNQDMRIMRRKQDWNAGFKAFKDNNTQLRYVVEFFTAPVA